MMIADSLDFQGFVQKRVGFGKFHILLVVSLIVVQMTDGMQAISISLVTPILKQQLELTQNQVSTFTSIFYLGVGIGAILSGLQSNSQGRRPSLLMGIFTQIISGLLLSLRVNFGWLCFLRLLYGCGFGSTLAVSTILATECLPMKYRGKALLIISACNSFGKMLGVCLAFIFLQGETKQWQNYMFASTLPCIIAFIICFLFVKESYRFMLSKKKTEIACKTINQIILINTKNFDQVLTPQEQNEIGKWASKTFTKTHQKQNIVSLLLQDKRTLICLCMGWFFVNFVSFGELFIVPFVIEAKDQGLIKYFWMTLGQLPSLVLTYTLIQRQGFGRKMSLIIFYSLSAIFCFFLFFQVNSLNLFLSKIVIKASFQMIYPFSSESYPTKTRSVAFALNSATGRIGSTIMPFILYPLYLSNANAPFLLLAIGSVLGAFSIWGVKQDTLRKALDQSNGQLQLSTQHSYKYQSSTEQQRRSI